MKQYITLTNAQPYAPHEIDAITDERIKATINHVIDLAQDAIDADWNETMDKHDEHMKDVTQLITSAMYLIEDDEPGEALDTLRQAVDTLQKGIE